MRWWIQVISVVRTQIWCPFVPRLPRRKKKNKCSGLSGRAKHSNGFSSLTFEVWTDADLFVFWFFSSACNHIKKNLSETEYATGLADISVCADQYLESIQKISLHLEDRWTHLEFRRSLEFQSSLQLEAVRLFILRRDTLWSVCIEISLASPSQPSVIYP